MASKETAAVPNSNQYDTVATVLAELQAEGYTTPDESTVRRWARKRRIRQQRFGVNNYLLVNRDDVRRLVIPCCIEAI